MHAAHHIPHVEGSGQAVICICRALPALSAIQPVPSAQCCSTNVMQLRTSKQITGSVTSVLCK